MKKLKLLIPWVFVALWMIIIFCFSAQEANESLNTSGGFAEFLARILHKDLYLLDLSEREEILGDCQFMVRKLAHFSVYSVLGVLSFIACKNSKLKFSQIIASVICVFYAASDEIHQHFVKGRSCEFRDVLIDFSGSVTGIIIISLILFIVGKLIKNKNENILQKE